MASFKSQFKRRIARKERATEEDLALYQAVANNRNAINVNDRLVPLMPLDEEDHLVQEPQAIASGQAAHWEEDQPDCGSRPKSVDHRSRQTPIKNQQDRGTCVSFASLACLEAILKESGKGEVDLSEQFAHWLFMNLSGRDQCEDQLRTTLAADFLAARGVCIETLAPYENVQTVTDHCEIPPSERARSEARYGIGECAIIDSLGLHGRSINNTDYLECLLYRGYDIVFGTQVAWGRPNVHGVHDVKLDMEGNPLTSRGAHAMLMVGYKRRKKGSFFIVKNSMGIDYAHGGYMYLSYDYIRLYAKYGYIVLRVRTDMPIVEA